MKKAMQNTSKVKYKRAIIWYFSGTGNARFAANQIQTNFQEEDLPTEVFNIADKDPSLATTGKDTLIGFCYPTHGFNAPPIVLKFMNSYPKGNSDLFLLNTRAGLKMSKLHIAGLGGIALWLPALLLWLKGYRPIGYRPLDMPSNWISLHPGLRQQAVTSIRKTCTQTLANFSNRIMQGKPVLNGLLWIPLDLLVLPFSILYYWYGRFALAKTFFANYKCNNCNLCIDDCPVQAIIEKNGRPFWTAKCESCMHCMNVCPHRAIDIAHVYLFLLWWLAFSFVPYLLVKLLIKADLISSTTLNLFTDSLADIIIMIVSLGMVFIGYTILHQLLGIKIINKVITFTSLTHYKWWRRYYLKMPSQKLK
jgi:ferredoxin